LLLPPVVEVSLTPLELLRGIISFLVVQKMENEYFKKNEKLKTVSSIKTSLTVAFNRHLTLSEDVWQNTPKT
jgi:hypothetical protein